MATAQAVLKALSNEQVRPFINMAKLVHSETFAQIAQMAVDHAIATGDLGYVERSLRLLRSSRFQDPVARWYRGRLALDFTRTETGLKPRRSSRAPNAKVLLRDHLPATRTSTIAKSSRRSKSRHDSDVDMLDHPARLPGSFGSGKRR